MQVGLGQVRTLQIRPAEIPSPRLKAIPKFDGLHRRVPFGKVVRQAMGRRPSHPCRRLQGINQSRWINASAGRRYRTAPSRRERMSHDGGYHLGLAEGSERFVRLGARWVDGKHGLLRAEQKSQKPCCTSCAQQGFVALPVGDT
jgi:hypothetical protein